MVLATIDRAFSHGLSVVKDGALYQPEQLVAIAKEYGATVFVANIEAPKDTLDERFRERVRKSAWEGPKVSNVSPERFDKLYAMYHDTKMETPLAFDSTSQSPQETVDTIVKHMRTA